MQGTGSQDPARTLAQTCSLSERCSSTGKPYKEHSFAIRSAKTNRQTHDFYSNNYLLSTLTTTKSGQTVRSTKARNQQTAQKKYRKLQQEQGSHPALQRNLFQVAKRIQTGRQYKNIMYFLHQILHRNFKFVVDICIFFVKC